MVRRCLVAVSIVSSDPGAPFLSAKVKTVMITDPDGNHLAFAEAIVFYTLFLVKA